MEKREYKCVELEVVERTSEDLLSRELDGEILDRMKKTIETEAPIRRSLLYKRVINSFSLQKLGSRLLPLFDSISTSLPFPTTEDSDGETVFHSTGEEDYFRPTPDSSVRYSYQIPHSEAASAIIHIISSSEKNSWTRSELYRAFLSEMGWEKSGRAIEELFSNAVTDHRIRRSGNGRILK
ncbi:MAG: DUF3320 domain-containing protein [Candidatus Ornithospirochaeta sp.]